MTDIPVNRRTSSSTGLDSQINEVGLANEVMARAPGHPSAKVGSIDEHSCARRISKLEPEGVSVVERRCQESPTSALDHAPILVVSIPTRDARVQEPVSDPHIEGCVTDRRVSA